jgi:hypothetical protein
VSLKSNHRSFQRVREIASIRNKREEDEKKAELQSQPNLNQQTFQIRFCWVRTVPDRNPEALREIRAVDASKGHFPEARSRAVRRDGQSVVCGYDL